MTTTKPDTKPQPDKSESRIKRLEEQVAILNALVRANGWSHPED